MLHVRRYLWWDKGARNLLWSSWKPVSQALWWEQTFKSIYRVSRKKTRQNAVLFRMSSLSLIFVRSSRLQRWGKDSGLKVVFAFKKSWDHPLLIKLKLKHKGECRPLSRSSTSRPTTSSAPSRLSPQLEKILRQIEKFQFYSRFYFRWKSRKKVRWGFSSRFSSR